MFLPRSACTSRTGCPGQYFLQVYEAEADAYVWMGESNTVVSAYTMYRHLQQYCSHPSIHTLTRKGCIP